MSMSPSSENSDESSHNNGSIIDNAYDVHGDDGHEGDNDNDNGNDNNTKMAGRTSVIAAPGATNMETAKHGITNSGIDEDVDMT